MAEPYFELDLPTFVIFVLAICVLTVQILLCFKVKRTFMKFIPMALLVVLTIVFSVCSASINGWDGLGYLFFALLSAGLIFVCGIGWGVWAIVRKMNR